MIQVELSTLQTSILSAIFLAQAATFLMRANEVDLSLDAQCFLVATLQACLFLHFNAYIAFAVACGLLGVFQGLKLIFNRKTGTDPLVNSIAAALVYLGVAYLTRYILYPEGGEPQYTGWISLNSFCYAAVGISLFFLISDSFLGPFRQTHFVLSPFGGLPSLKSSALWAVLPATILTCLAGTLLGLHAGAVTPAFSSNFGILGAVASILSYGRLRRGTLLGLAVGLLYVFEVMSVGPIPPWMPSDIAAVLDWSISMRSYLVPILVFFVLGAVATFWDRP